MKIQINEHVAITTVYDTRLKEYSVVFHKSGGNRDYIEHESLDRIKSDARFWHKRGYLVGGDMALVAIEDFDRGVEHCDQIKLEDEA